MVSEKKLITIGLLLTGITLFQGKIVNENLISPKYKTELLREQQRQCKVESNNIAFSEFEAPPGLEGAVDFWYQLYDKYSFEKIVFFDKKFRIRAVHDSITRQEYDDMSRWEKIRNVRQIDKIRDTVEDKTGEEIMWRRGAEDNLNFKNMHLYYNACKKAMARTGINPDLASVWLLETSGNIFIASKNWAIGPFQYTAWAAKEDCDMIIDNAVDERLDPVIAAENFALQLLLYLRRHGNKYVATNTFHSGIKNLDRAMYFTKTMSKKLGLEERLSQEDVLTYISTQFPEQPREITGSYRFSSSNYVPAIFAVMRLAKKWFPTEIVKIREIEYEEIKLDYKEPDKKLDIRQVIEMQGFPARKMAELNPHILYLQKITRGEKTLRNMMSSYKTKRITPRLTEGCVLRVPLGKSDEFLEQYKDLLASHEFEKHTRQDQIRMPGKPGFSLGDMRYAEILEMRKQLRHKEVTPKLLRKVRKAYYRDQLLYPESEYIKTCIQVINRDIKRTMREREQNYWESIEDYQEKISKILKIGRKRPTQS